MNLVADNKCTFCNDGTETLIHLFWDCEYVSYFWNGFEMILKDNCGLNDMDFNVRDIIFGNPEFDDLMNELLFLAKRYIYHMKMVKREPSLNNFLNNIVSLHYKTSKYIAVRNQAQRNWEKKWDKYKDLLDLG